MISDLLVISVLGHQNCDGQTAVVVVQFMNTAFSGLWVLRISWLVAAEYAYQPELVQVRLAVPEAGCVVFSYILACLKTGTLV